MTVQRRSWNRSVPFSEWKKWGETQHQTDAEGRYEFTLPPEQAADPSLYIEITAKHADYVRFYGGYSFDMIRKNEALGERPFYEKVDFSRRRRSRASSLRPTVRRPRALR